MHMLSPFPEASSIKASKQYSAFHTWNEAKHQLVGDFWPGELSGLFVTSQRTKDPVHVKSCGPT